MSVKLPASVNQRTGENSQIQRKLKMAKKNTGGISADEVKSGTVFIDASAFDSMAGETFAGLNILKLNPNQAAGPITIKDILLNQRLGKDSAAKKRKPVDVYVGEHNGVQIRLPVAASFVQKAKDAKLTVGDVIAIKRGADYTSQFKTRGASYELKVISRASKK